MQNLKLNPIKKLKLIVNNIFIGFVNIYQKYISPLSGPNCRHYPSCSEYSKQSLIKYGVIKGLVLSISRIIRCNPWSLGGYDPVPENVRFKELNSFKLLGNYQTKLYQQQED